MQNKTYAKILFAILLVISIYASIPRKDLTPPPKATPTNLVLGDRPVKWIDDPGTGNIVLNPVCRGIGVLCDDIYYSKNFQTYWRLGSTPIVPTVTPMGTIVPTRTALPINTPIRCFRQWCWR
jgi:hypothetical protein